MDIGEQFLGAGIVKHGTDCQGMHRNLLDGNLKNQVRPLLFGALWRQVHPAPALGLDWSGALLLSTLLTWLCPRARPGRHVCNTAEGLFCGIAGVYLILSMQGAFLAGS